MLATDSVSAVFGGLRALCDVSLEVHSGEVVGLIGPNGAGKTSLLNVLTGFVTPSSGTVSIDGRNLDRQPPDVRVRLGIGRSFQTPRLAPEAPVVEILATAAYASQRSRLLDSMLRTPRYRREAKAIAAVTADLIERFGFTAIADIPCGNLAIWQMRCLEVARAVALQTRYMLLDEPAAGLGGDEQEALARYIQQVGSDAVGVLLVEHNFDFVRRLCDRVVVLDQGRVLAVGSPADVSSDERVRELYLGGIHAGTR